ncbi:conserved hypothetical protein [Rhodospirillaceae bacterium LM-1]|nr:conserved hypothetical protein [Rhodospirillaceae bacterium LM-1]
MANQKRKALTDKSGEVRELKKEDFAKAKTFADLPEGLRKTLSTRKRGPQKAPTKELISIRLSSDVLERFRDSGRGWQGRVNVALREWLAAHGG